MFYILAQSTPKFLKFTMHAIKNLKKTRYLFIKTDSFLFYTYKQLLQFGEIPLEFLEELVTESLFTRNILLADANKGHNFANLVQRASGNYIRGAVRVGRNLW